MKNTKAQKTITETFFVFFVVSDSETSNENFFGRKYMLQYNFRGYFSKWSSMVVISRSIIDYGFGFFEVLVSQTSNYRTISLRMVCYINSLYVVFKQSI